MEARAQLSAVMDYLADLAPVGAPSPWTVNTRKFVHIDPRAMTVVATDPPTWDVTQPGLAELVELEELHPGEHLLRVGWLFLVGEFRVGRGTQSVFLPLASGAARANPLRAGRYRIRVTSDLEPASHLLDLGDREAIEIGLEELVHAGAGDGYDAPTTATMLRNWVAALLAPAGLDLPPLLPPDRHPRRVDDGGGLRLCTGMGAYLGRDVDSPSIVGALRTWALADLTGTAFDAVYGPEPGAADADAPAPWEPASVLPLNAAQRRALVRARTDPITVVSGPPGTGKSHLVAAVATDLVAEGRSVLVATQSDYAADVIAGLFERHPGPRFVRFGDYDDRTRVADELSGGMATPYPRGEVERITGRRDQAARRRRRAEDRIAAGLRREQEFVAGLDARERLAGAGLLAPQVLYAGFDSARARTLLDRALDPGGFLGGLRSRFAHRRLRRHLALGNAAPTGDLMDIVELAEAEAAVRSALTGGGLTLDADWVELARAEGQWRQEQGRVIEARRRARESSRRDSNRAVAALASALRAGRVRRRRVLRDLRSGHFLDVLPLWLGTLKDIDDTLPVEPGAFDVVIFDEASQIDQMRAAPALARAQRAVVVGDPRQLRHVSFVGDDAMRRAAAARDLPDDTARILDIRGNSLFDAATAAAGVTWLDEHFRSVPHIIGFSDRRFYDRRLRLMTQHPAHESRDAIRKVRVAGQRNERGVNEAEVDAARRLLADAIADGVESVGLVSPFRAQADALWDMVVMTFPFDVRHRHGIRVGTVHAFQGNERDVMIVSLGLGDGDLGTSLRFVEDPNLFNVMVTRARDELVLVHSFDPGGLREGLLAEYLRHADHPPLPAETAGAPSGWLAELSAAIGGYGVRRVPRYPVGGWEVDLAVGEGDAALAVECAVHEDGPAAHIERHLALRRAGWRVGDAFQSRWLARPDAAVESIVERVLGPSGEASER